MERNTQYDVIIVGGGFTGTAAAVAAARGGAKTLILEQSGALGGAAVNCLILPFMSWWTNIEADGKKERFYLSRGIFAEICDELKKFGAMSGNEFHEEYLKVVLERMAIKEGVDLLFHATLCETEKDGETLKNVTVITKSGKLTFSAHTFIDCTGDADLAVMAGCPWHLGRPDGLCQPMTLCFRVANVNEELFWSEESRKKMQALYKQAQKDGRTSNPRENVLVFRTLVKGVIHFNTTRVIKLDPVDPFDVTVAEIEARKQMLELFDLLKAELEAFKDAQLLTSGAWIGARESRMIDGEHLLTEEELKNCTRFEDAIAAGNYDIDIHSPDGSGTSHYYFPDGQYYTIPYRSLIPKNAENLLVAGRCISSSHEAQASYRIMPIVTCLGEAAGTAAAECVKNNCGVRQADIRAIQKTLTDNGAFIG